ncbi:MAG: TlpA family protein disulfide reductase [Bacteroidales bacterium]|jgi:thiol-disulfide isomerase/thioredoxin|nr:TlpA family protein disulfide reductase [Bacteroidales bacterium]
MKQIYFILCLFFLNQCNPAESGKKEQDIEMFTQEQSSKSTQITGVIHNRNTYPNTKEIKIKIPYISGKNRTYQIVSPILDDGSFYFKFDLAQAQDISMETYINFLYLIPGDSLHIEIDFNNLTDIQFSGNNSANINRDFYQYFDEIFYRGYSIGTECLINCSMEEIREKLDETRVLYLSKRDSFLRNHQVQPEVIFLTKAMIELDYYTELSHIVKMRSFRQINTTPPDIFMNELNTHATKYFGYGLYSNSHFRFINSGYLQIAFLKKLPESAIMHLAEWVSDMAYNDTIKEFSLSCIASDFLQTKDLKSFEEVYTHIENKYLHERLMHEYQQTWRSMEHPEAISSGIVNEPSDFTGPSSSSENIMTQTITPNYGKVQVINISATWCPPCHSELSNYKYLITKYNNQDVSFSFICAGGNEQEWGKLLQKNELTKEHHHFCSDTEFRFLAKTFSPIGFPYGILVNKKGVIVDHGLHVRSERIEKKIDLLLKQDTLIE